VRREARAPTMAPRHPPAPETTMDTSIIENSTARYAKCIEASRRVR